MWRITKASLIVADSVSSDPNRVISPDLPIHVALRLRFVLHISCWSYTLAWSKSVMEI